MRLPVTAALLAVSAFAQTAPLEFEVASVKPSSTATEARAQVGMHIDGAQFTCNYLTLRDYIAMAYNLKLYQISGPEWINSQRFDIAAKLPAGASRKDVPQMLKALLAERLQLKLHNEKKEFPVYALVIAKGGAHVKETPKDSATPDENINITGGGDARGTSVNLGNGSSFTFSNDKFEAHKLTMPVFAASLSRFVDKPIVDMTDLKEAYEITLDVSPEDFMGMQIRSGINAGVELPPQVVQMADKASLDSLFASMTRQGLKLEQRKAPLDIVVVDSASKTAAAN